MAEYSWACEWRTAQEHRGKGGTNPMSLEATRAALCHPSHGWENRTQRDGRRSSPFFTFPWSSPFFPFPSFSAISRCSIWEEEKYNIFSPSSFLLKQASWLSCYPRGLRVTVPSVGAGGGDSWDEELLTSYSQSKAIFLGGRGKHRRSHQLSRLQWPQNSRIKAQRALKKFLTPFYAQSFLQLNNNRSLYTQFHHDFIFPSEVANCCFKKNIKNC